MTGRLKTAHPLMLLACMALFALTALQAVAQDLNKEALDTARKFDEFGRVGGCDYGARLDNFVNQLQNEPTQDGYIICYGPEGEGSGTGNFALRVAKAYIVTVRGMDEERIKTIYAGRYKEWNEAATELWIAPHDAAPPEPIRYNTRVETFTGKFAEFDAWDTFTGEEGTGPTHGNVRLASLADILHQQRDTRVFIVAYNKKKGAVPGAWRRVARDIASNFENGYKVEAERIKIIYAGYREEKKKDEDEGIDAPVFVQLWVLPVDAPPPVAEVKEAEERPSEAVQLSSFSAYQIADEEEARRAFEGFADVLRNDEKLNACLIVRLSKKSEKKPEAGETIKPDNAPDESSPNELPKADLMALVEKWKADLVKDYGISEHRLVVTTGEASEWSDGDVETWIVPHGAALPDPEAKDETIEGEGEMAEGDQAVAVEEQTPKEF
jgi:hypothetical protein